MATKPDAGAKIIIFGLLAILVAWFIFGALQVGAITVSSPQDPILDNDIVSSMIASGTIVRADVSGSANLDPASIGTTTAVDFVRNAAQTFDGVKTFSSIPATTGGNCTNDNDLCRKAYVDAAGATTISLVAAETFAIGEPVSMATSTWEIQQALFDPAGVAASFGNITLNSREIAVGWNQNGALLLGGVRVMLSKTGSPADSVNIALYGDSGGNPDGVTLRSASTSGANIDGTARFYSFYFPSITLATSTQYHIVYDRSGADSDAAYYNMYVAANSDARGNYQTRTDGWNAAITDDGEIGWLSPVAAGEAFRSGASFATSTEGYVGIATTAAATGSTVTVATTAKVTGLSGLSTGRLYLQTATGTLGVNPGVIKREAAFGYSATALIVRP